MSDFKNELEQEVEFINDLISRYLPDETGLDKKIREAMNYSVNAGGKRVRPMLMLEVYKLCGGDDCQVVYPFMAALECIHSYSLVHDDLPAMDNDDYRRGRLTTHKVFGEDFGILAGDGLLNLAYEIMAEALISGEGDMTAKAKAMEVIARKAGIKGMVGGQAVDVELTGKALSDQSVRRMIKKYSSLANIDLHITPHMFRHTFATCLLDTGVDIRFIQEMLGHSSINVTEIYTHVTVAKQKDILTTKHPRKDFQI